MGTDKKGIWPAHALGRPLGECPCHLPAWAWVPFLSPGAQHWLQGLWGALVGETGRSHLTSTVPLGHHLDLRASWEYVQGSWKRDAVPSLGPEDISSPRLQEAGSTVSGDAKQPLVAASDHPA